jgi:hypothetical protein
LDGKPQWLPGTSNLSEPTPIHKNLENSMKTFVVAVSAFSLALGALAQETSQTGSGSPLSLETSEPNPQAGYIYRPESSKHNQQEAFTPLRFCAATMAANLSSSRLLPLSVRVPRA